MVLQDLLTQTNEIRPGDHLVALYEKEQEIADYVTSYIHASLQRQERCIYITGDVDTSLVLRGIEDASPDHIKSGALVVLDRNEIYSKGGKFSPDKLITLLQSMVEQALQEGYAALSITGELSWVLDYADGEDLIIEYEWKLNERVFDHYPVSALCRYNLGRFSDIMIRNIIQLHPIILWKNRIHENPYYIPPEGFKSRTTTQYEVATWLQNIYSFSDTKTRFRTLVEKKQEELHQLHQKMTNGVIKAFLKLLETHDPYTNDHCNNVAALSMRLAKELRTSAEFQARLYYAALIHDIGKTIIPKEILNKPEPLTDEEYDVIQLHPAYGAQALAEVDQMAEIASAIRHHHEAFNGCGYPDGLRGEAIPLMARIIALCDSFDAMTNDRPYRRAMTTQEALAEIKACAGTQFDPELAAKFVHLFQ